MRLFIYQSAGRNPRLSNTLEETIPWPKSDGHPDSILLGLTVTDSDTLQALARYAAWPARDEFAPESLKIGAWLYSMHPERSIQTLSSAKQLV